QDVSLQSHSDTEVLLHLLRIHGASILPKLRGMFAFAYWNGETKQLLLATDPFGKKPLYYAEHNNQLLFASEPKAILAYPGFVREADTTEVAHYLLHEYVPAPASGWMGIKQLSMGQLLRVTDHVPQPTTCWTPP